MEEERSLNPFDKRPGRRSVQMRAYVVRSDQQIIDVSVEDLSQTGCAVHTDTPLRPGEVVLLSVLSRGGGRAIVRWYRDRVAGLDFEADQVSGEQQIRSVDRRPASAEVFLRRSGRARYRVRVFDVSPSGCRCEFIERPLIGERVWIKFDQLEALECEVRWVEEFSTGLLFTKPLHPAVFNAVLQGLS